MLLEGKDASNHVSALLTKPATAILNLFIIFSINSFSASLISLSVQLHNAL